jgi:6-phosphogluconate dehydrogenase (decarboxylating)
MSNHSITVVGLGRMGANISRRIKLHAQSPAINGLRCESRIPSRFPWQKDSLHWLHLRRTGAVYRRQPRTVWVMVPAEVTAQTISPRVVEHLAPGSTTSMAKYASLSR